MSKHFLPLVVLLAAAPSVSLAQDTYDWSGFYAGVFGGHGSATTSLSNAIVNGTPQPVTPGNETQEAAGLFGGVQVGADVQLDNFVLGIQSGIAKSAIQTNESNGDPSDTLNWFATTTGRLGYAFGNVLPYLEAGIVVASATGYAVDVPASNIHTGWTAGGGVELGLTENVSLGIEYNYLALGTQNYVFTGPSVGNISMDASQSVQTVKAAINFRF